MQTEKDLAQKFIQYLKEHGYPEESIVCEWKIKNYRVDIAIIDSQTKKVMAIYELKDISHINCNISENHIIKYLCEIGDYTIPAYIVYNYENDCGFIVKKIEINNKKIMNFKYEKDIVNYIPDYELLQNSFDNGYITQKIQEKERVKDNINIICIFICILVIIILILDIMGKIEMTTNRLILLGLAIGLFLFPLLESIKVLGIELERKNKNNN